MKELLEKILGQIKKTPEGVRAYEDLYHICLETQKTDIPLSVEYLKKLSDIIENRIPQSETDKELRSLFMLHKKVLLAAAPFDFESYLLYVEWEREPDKKFYVPRREVMHPVVQAMQDLIDDRLDLLTISMPPGTGKSTLGIFFLSWVMGRFPDSQSLASAHSGMLTRSFYDGVYQIITDSEYLWADVFPGVKMAATNSKEETIDLHKKHRFSTLTCRAINASLTGATRCDKILYADDLCSGIEEAMSKERLDKLWSAYTNDLKSRKKEGAKEIHIATRWSVHDVIGRLENQYGGDSRAKFIVLPALDADGESNFNYTYGVGFSRHYEELSPDEKVRYEKLMEKNTAFAEWFIADERKVIVDCLRSITEEVYVANSIYPTYREELIERRVHQDRAVGQCYRLTQELQYAIETLPVDVNKYLRFAEMIQTEINLLKGWRKSDNKFKSALQEGNL